MNMKLIAVLLAAASGAAIAMTPAELRAHAERIEAEYKAAAVRCKPLKGNDRDMCLVRAKAERHVARADLQLVHKPGAESSEKLALARADAAHAIAKERCDDLRGHGKEVCRKDAKAALARARAEARTLRASAASDIKPASREASSPDALYAAGVERCDALTGQARELCVADLRRRFGKL